MKSVLCDPRADAVLARLDEEARRQNADMRRYWRRRCATPSANMAARAS